MAIDNLNFKDGSSLKSNTNTDMILTLTSNGKSPLFLPVDLDFDLLHNSYTNCNKMSHSMRSFKS